ncbi:MAG: BamA/TamA family outer membrane protein [Chitinophagales bacterium]
MRRFLVIGLCFWNTVHICAQSADAFVLHTGSFENKKVAQFFGKDDRSFASPEERSVFLRERMLDLAGDGYLTAAWDTLKDSGDTLYIQVETGEQVFWAGLDLTDVDKNVLRAAGIKENTFEQKVFRYDVLVGMFRRMLRYAEDNGYPFAQVQLQHIVWSDTSIHATMFWDKGPLITFDTILVKGDLNISANYLEQYTGIHSGEIYNETLLREVDDRLRALTFARLTKNTQVIFSGDRAKVVFWLDEKKASRFDFIIGVLPNNEITGRLIITGDATLGLQNVFGAGESVYMHFSKLESTSKEFIAKATYPYLPGLALGLDGSFSLYLKDSTFLERNANFGLLYSFIGNNYVKAFAHVYASSILSVDTAYILAYKDLPAQLDVSETGYGLQWNTEHLDYRYNPRRGFAWNVSGSVGTRTILENAVIASLQDPLDPAFDFTSLYDSTDKQVLSIRYAYDLRYYIPWPAHAAILLQMRGASMIHDQILENELFRIGGNMLLRGFDERAIPVSTYHIFTTEFHYILSQNGYASLFFDGGYTLNASDGNTDAIFPFGFGAGINFETKAGVFGVQYALGGTQQTPVALRSAKVHFGYVNYF